MKFKQNVFTCSNRNLGEVLSLSTARSSRASQIFYYIFKIFNNFVRNEGPSFLLFTSQFIATNTQVSIVSAHSFCVFYLWFFLGGEGSTIFHKYYQCAVLYTLLYFTRLHIYMAVFANKKRRPLTRCATISMLLVLLFYQQVHLCKVWTNIFVDLNLI